MTVKQLKNIIADEKDSMEVILLKTVGGEERHFSLSFAGTSENEKRLALEVVEEIKV
jgi:hypothetical protein